MSRFFVHDILVYMVQKYLVNNICHHLMINSLYKRVFIVCFYFVGKMGKFQSDPVKDVGSHGNLLNLMMYLGNLISVRKDDFAYLFGGMSCL